MFWGLFDAVGTAVGVVGVVGVVESVEGGGMKVLSGEVLGSGVVGPTFCKFWGYK